MQMEVVFAQANYKTGVPTLNYIPLTPLPFTGDCAPEDITAKKTHCLPTTVPNLGRYLRGVYMLGVALAGLFAVFSIVSGGFTLLFTDSILGHSEGKTKILHALGGLLIVYSSYILMNQINPQLGRDLNLSLALPRITVTKGLFGQLVSFADTNAQTAVYSQLRGEITQGVKDSRVRADKEEAAARAIMADPKIRDLISRRESVAELQADGADIPPGLALTADENAFLTRAIEESDKHVAISDNTRFYQLGVAEIEAEVVDSQHLVRSPWWTFVPDPMGTAITPEERARYISQKIKGRIDSLDRSTGEVVTDPAGVTTKTTTAAAADLVTKANEAIMTLCNRQYGTTPASPATVTVTGPTGRVDTVTNGAVTKRNNCITANSITR